VQADESSLTSATMTTEEHILSLSVKCKQWRKWRQWWRGGRIAHSCCAWWGRQEVLGLLQEWCQFEQTWTFWERATCHSSHLIKTADITPHLFYRGAFWEPTVCLHLPVWCLMFLTGVLLCNSTYYFFPHLLTEEWTSRMSCALKPQF
jgi:hypothetical protein